MIKEKYYDTVMKDYLDLEIYENGTKRYYYKNLYHRLDGPAVEWSSGDQLWYQYSKLHRLDGPAIDFNDATKKWYYQDQRIHCTSQEEFERLLKLKAFW